LMRRFGCDGMQFNPEIKLNLWSSSWNLALIAFYFVFSFRKWKSFRTSIKKPEMHFLGFINIGFLDFVHRPEFYN
jgi:hypothetical protein